MVSRSALLLLVLAGALAACGELRKSEPEDGGVTKPDGPPAGTVVAEPDGAVGEVAGASPDGAVGDGASATLDGPGIRSLDAATVTGPPMFLLADPSGLQTARDPALPLRLREQPSGGPATLAFKAMFADRVLGEQALRGLVTLTDMTNGTPVAYEIGEPVRDVVSGLAALALTPATPLAANAWYRVTVYPGETQQLVTCRTLSGRTSKLLTAPETTDFYTGSRPMVADLFIPDKGGGKGYFQFDFTEALVAADLAAYPMAVVAVDGVALPGCPSPYACAGAGSSGPAAIRLDVTALPASFTTVTLRVPHAVRATGGGTILAGTVGNPHATVDGDFAVYTFKAADMVLTDNSLVKRWFYVGP